MLTCPYCNKKNEVPEESHEEDTLYETQCEHCDMNFVFAVSWSPFYSEDQAPCLNGGEHDYREMVGLPKEHFKDRFRCFVCEHEIRK